jgi:type 1 glutamine amidotransferase
MKKNTLTSLLFIFTFLLSINLRSQSIVEFEVTPKWLSKIEAITPLKTTVKAKKRNVLLFSLHTGFKHWVIPHSAAIIQTIADKTGAFNVTQTMDATIFTSKGLKRYDVVVMNNNCSIGPRRDMFYDALGAVSDTVERAKKAAQLEVDLLDYVKKGGGLVVLHGGIVMQNNSEEVSDMIGGSFDYHPAQQLLNVKLADKSHKLVQAFNGEGFQHIDEPYFFKNAYDNYNFRPLLYVETRKLELKKPESQNIKYISWIKRYGKGRVFYSSPSHNAQSYDNPNLIAFIMNGLQYAAGDLKCDDSPIGKKPE